MSNPRIISEDWTGQDVSIAQIERELARLRDASSSEGEQPNLRTSVMTHIAWVPPHWRGAAEETLAGMAERHPSRTLLLVPEPEAENGLDAEVSVRSFPVGERAICGEVIQLALRGNRSRAPASIVAPLLISDLPVFCRWRGEPPFGADEFEQLVDLADRLIVDSGEWETLRYAELARLFDRSAVSDLAWARTLDWRRELAGHWPAIREQTIEIAGPLPEATLLRGWLRSRLERAVDEPRELKNLKVSLDGEPVELSRTDATTPSDLLSAELDRFGRDRIYEAAVQIAV